MKKNKNITTYNEHLDKQYGKKGSVKRTEFEIKAKAFLNKEFEKEKLLKKRLSKESKLVSSNSMKILSEFEN